MGLPEAVSGLIQHGEVEALKRMVPAGFNWCQPDPITHTPYLLLAAANGLGRGSSILFERYLNMLSWLMECGADPCQKASHRCELGKTFNYFDDRHEADLDVGYEGESAITWLLDARSQFERQMRDMDDDDDKPDWSDEFKEIDSMLAVLTASDSIQADRVVVSSSLVDLWESIYRDSSTHDVSLQTAHGAVTAHRHVLAKASPVLSAMLSSGMREGTQQSVDVKDAGEGGVTFFLELLYCGSSSCDVDCPSALTALDLAHRWQIPGVVAMVERAIPDMVTDDTFASVAEAACLKNLSYLKASCREFASKSKAVQDKLKKGQLPEPVSALLGKPAQSSQQQKKRRRTF